MHVCGTTLAYMGRCHPHRGISLTAILFTAYDLVNSDQLDILLVIHRFCLPSGGVSA